MKDFYNFAQENPILTFFIVALVCECIYKSFQGLGGLLK